MNAAVEGVSRESCRAGIRLPETDPSCLRMTMWGLAVSWMSARVPTNRNRHSEPVKNQLRVASQDCGEFGCQFRILRASG